MSDKNRKCHDTGCWPGEEDEVKWVIESHKVSDTISICFDDGTELTCLREEDAYNLAVMILRNLGKKLSD